MKVKKECKNCEIVFESHQAFKQRFCSQKCSYEYHTYGRPDKEILFGFYRDLRRWYRVAKVLEVNLKTVRKWRRYYEALLG